MVGGREGVWRELFELEKLYYYRTICCCTGKYFLVVGDLSDLRYVCIVGRNIGGYSSSEQRTYIACNHFCLFLTGEVVDIEVNVLLYRAVLYMTFIS